MKANNLILIIAGFFIMIPIIIIPTQYSSYTNDDISTLDQKYKENSGKGVYSCGNWYYGKKRILLTDTPQKYSLPLGYKYSFWPDNNKTALDFEIRISPDGEPTNSNEVYYIPTDQIWVSKKKGNPSQYYTFMYTK